MRKLIAVAAALLIAGCGKGVEADQGFLDAAPELESYLAEVTGDANETGTSSSGLTLEGFEQQQQAVESVPEYLQQAQTAVASLNEAMRAILEPIVAAIQEDPSTADEGIHVWGPTDRGNATYKFTMKKARDRQYGWLLQAKPKGGGDDQYVGVMAGGIKVGERARRGVGLMGIDADKLAAVDSGIKARGKLLVGFAHGALGGKALAYVLKDFTPNVDEHQAVSALFRAVRGPLGGTIVRLATYSDISTPRNGSRELVLSRTRWIPGVGGRFDGLGVNGTAPMTEGDLEAGKFFVAQGCWDGAKQGTHRRLTKCTVGQPINATNCQVLVSEKKVDGAWVPGSWAIGERCFPLTQPALQEELPDSIDPNAAPDEAADEGLEGAVAPAAMPDGSGN